MVKDERQSYWANGFGRFSGQDRPWPDRPFIFPKVAGRARKMGGRNGGGDRTVYRTSAQTVTFGPFFGSNILGANRDLLQADGPTIGLLRADGEHESESARPRAQVVIPR